MSDSACSSSTTAGAAAAFLLAHTGVFLTLSATGADFDSESCKSTSIGSGSITGAGVGLGVVDPPANVYFFYKINEKKKTDSVRGGLPPSDLRLDLLADEADEEEEEDVNGFCGDEKKSSMLSSWSASLATLALAVTPVRLHAEATCRINKWLAREPSYRPRTPTSNSAAAGRCLGGTPFCLWHTELDRYVYFVILAKPLGTA